MKNQKIGGYGDLALNTVNFMFAFKFTHNAWNNWSKPIMPMKLYNSVQIKNISGIYQIDDEIQMVNCSLKNFPTFETEFL